MPDPRVENFAKIIIQHSTRIQPGDKVAIRGFPLTPAATPLINAVTEQVLHAGGYPHLLMTPPGFRNMIYTSSSDDHLNYINPFAKMIIEDFDVDIRISSEENTKSLSNLDPSRLNVVRKSYFDLVQTWFQRAGQGSLRWLTTRYPTLAYAQEAEMSLREYEDFFYSSCFADLENPIETFENMALEQKRVIKLFEGGEQLQFSGPHIDLNLSIKGRPFIACIGENNLPDGEIYCGPIEDSADGWVRFSFPCIHLGKQVEEVELEFKAGKVVHARASKNEDYLHKTLVVDEGASRLGEFGIGLNPAIDRFTGSMIFDEKIDGTIHFALGAGYPESGSINKSSIHWDMLTDMRTDSEIRLDGELIYRDGKFN